MAQEKGYRRLSELVEALAAAERRLTERTLDLAGLETSCDDARELYERLVVLRHKAREAMSHPSTERPAAVPKEKGKPAPTTTAAAEPAGASNAIRLDTRPAEAAPRQVSLIEAIEATEQVGGTPVPVKPTAAKAEKQGTGSDKAPSTVAEKLEKAAIADLAKAISLSHKFWFVAELFNGDRIAYDKGVEAINAQPDLAQAMTYLQEKVLSQLKKPADPEALSTFNELIQRRFA